MTIEPCNPEIISLEDYQPTSIDNLFLNPDTNTAVFVGAEVAYKVTATE